MKYIVKLVLQNIIVKPKSVKSKYKIEEDERKLLPEDNENAETLVEAIFRNRLRG